MSPENMLSFVTPFLIILGIAAAIAGGVYFFFSLRRGEDVQLSLRGLFRGYLYIMSLASLLIMISGISHLVQWGFAVGFGNEFSYRPARVEAIRPAERFLYERGVQPPELTAEEREEMRRLDEERRIEGLDLAFKTGLLDGIIFTAIGALLWGAHLWGRRRLETVEEQESSALNRIYLIVLILVLGVITISTLPVAARDALRYGLLDTGLAYSPPGGRLGTAIAVMPFWLVYLWVTVRGIRHQSSKTT
jgi:hypothetical protein